MIDAPRPEDALSKQSAELPAHIRAALREFNATRPPEAADDQLEAVRAAVMLEDVADVLLSDDLIDPRSLADEDSMALVVRQLRGAR